MFKQCGICDSEYDREVGKNFYCSNCETIYTPLYDKTIYNETYRNKYLEYEMSSHNPGIQTYRWNLIREFVCPGKDGENKNLLDIGCGVGAFLNVVRMESTILSEPKFKIQGQDINPYCVETVNNRGIPCYQDLADVLDYKKFDVITMWDVIEHFPNFDVPFTVREALKPEGYFIFCTPNFDPEVVNPDDIESWKHHRPGEHVWNFSCKSIEMLAKKLCFSKVAKVDYGESEIRKPAKNIATYVLQK